LGHIPDLEPYDMRRYEEGYKVDGSSDELPKGMQIISEVVVHGNYVISVVEATFGGKLNEVVLRYSHVRPL
jgi:hypothetical protein